MADPARHPPVGFAHRGASSLAPANTLEAFRLALDLGATGLESDVWLTTDGVAVLDHDGVFRSGLRRRRVRDLTRRQLPAHVPSLADLYAELGAGYELSLDVKDPDAAPAVVAEARAAGGDAAGRLWLCSPDWRLAASWRALDPDVRLVASASARRMREGQERFTATVAAAGIDAVNLHQSDWTGGFTTLVHRFGLECLAWDCQHPRLVVRMLAAGCDGLYGDDVEVLMSAIAEYAR